MATLRERRLWLAATLTLGAIYAAIYPGQFALDALRSRGLLRATILGLFLAAAAVLLYWAARRRPGRREWTVLAAGAAAYVPIVASLPVLQERLHFVEYGALAGLTEAALRERWRVAELAASPRSTAAALAATAGAGWIDEALQALVPHRVYDLRDVGLNAGAGLLALALLAARRRARALDRAAVGG
jgi:hypothetical protein